MTRYLEDTAKPLHGQPVTSIDRRTIADLLSRVARESGPVSANRLRASMSAMFGWAIREGLVDLNPVIGTGKREERSRDRVLTDAELSAVWAATQDDRYGAIIRLLILTGSRAREISDLRWSEIDFDHGKIALPAERTKNGRPHEIPMSIAVQEILSAQPKTGDRVFGTFSGWSRLKTALDARIQNPEPGSFMICAVPRQREWAIWASRHMLSRLSSIIRAGTRAGSPGFTIAPSTPPRRPRPWHCGLTTSWLWLRGARATSRL